MFLVKIYISVSQGVCRCWLVSVYVSRFMQKLQSRFSLNLMEEGNMDQILRQIY